MKTGIAVLIFIGSTMLMHADQLVERVQQALKDQGFYYGEVSGEMNANVTAAIRRYQIRNGLQVSGELNSETLKSLGVGSSASPQPGAKPAPSASTSTSDLSNPSAGETTAPPPPRVQPFANAPEDRQVYPSNPVTPGASQGGLLAGTPYETAPPDVQRNVVVSAQIGLARRGLYRGEIDGVFRPVLEFSLRAYQA